MSANNSASNKINNSNTRCIQTQVHTYTQTHTCTNTQSNIHTQAHTKRNTHTNRHTHTNIHTFTQTHAQTYTDPPVVVYIHRRTQTSPVVVYVVTDTVKPVQKRSIAKLAIGSGVPSQKSCSAVNGVKPWAMQLCWFFRMLPLKSVARTDVDRIEVSLSFSKHGEEGADKQDRVLISSVKEINKIARRALQC